MKINCGHVTNSSSSSFIISRDQVKRKKLIKILLEIANKEYSYYDDKSDNDEFHYTLEDDVIEDCVAGRYHIKKQQKNIHLMIIVVNMTSIMILNLMIIIGLLIMMIVVDIIGMLLKKY